jgi:hypothetical protein
MDRESLQNKSILNKILNHLSYISSFKNCVLPKLLKFTYITYMVQETKHG